MTKNEIDRALKLLGENKNLRQSAYAKHLRHLRSKKEKI